MIALNNRKRKAPPRWGMESFFPLTLRTRLAQAIFPLFLLVAALFWHNPPAAAQDMPSEQSLRAALVFNFLKFTEFPPEGVANTQPAQPIRLCVIAGDPLQVEALNALSGRRVGTRELTVVRLSGRDDGCQVLYVDLRQRWNVIKEQRAFLRTLTISAYPGFARDGGMIEIALQEDGARFEINLAEGRRAGLRFSPQLLRLARRIHE
jgi:hypothetical protein